MPMPMPMPIKKGGMRNAIWTASGLLIAGLFVASCGGSSSETPWPVEPEATVQGPAGEASPGSAIDDRAEPSDAGPPARRRPSSPL